MKMLQIRLFQVLPINFIPNFQVANRFTAMNFPTKQDDVRILVSRKIIMQLHIWTKWTTTFAIAAAYLIPIGGYAFMIDQVMAMLHAK